MIERKIEFEGRASSYSIIQIESEEHFLKIIDEMKDYARSSEFDYDQARQEIVHKKDAITDLGDVIRSTSETDVDYMKQWTRFIGLGDDVIQITYYEFELDDHFPRMGQLQIANSYEPSFTEGVNQFIPWIVNQFVPEGSEDECTIPNDLPPNVLIIFIPIH